MSTDSAMLHAKLKEFFGFDSFKSDQERIIRHLVDGNNAFVLMPTGGGKSMCYQLPALVMDHCRNFLGRVFLAVDGNFMVRTHVSFD